MNDRKTIQVVAYDPNWPHVFEKEAGLIKQALGDNCLQVHHIGSTSVPGLAAKEDIDICVVVQHLQKNLENYTFKGEINIPLRYFFNKNTLESKVNLHMVESDHEFLSLNLCFIGYLRSHDEARLAYAMLKQDLLKEPEAMLRTNMRFSGYTLGKYQFINTILDKAGFKAIRLMHCMHPVEWAAAKYFRDTYFFAPHGIVDPYTWTFNHEEHAHLVLYQGTQVIGYAHVQFWPEQRAAIRIIAVDENKRNQSFGRKFLALIEKWLYNLGIKSLHAESRQSSLRFYLKNGYTNMTFDDPENHESDTNDIPVGKVL